MKQNVILREIVKIENTKISYDIINPNFTINSSKEKISIKANGASFINDEEILLQKNVIFKSDKFTIKSPEVFFNQNNETAHSEKDSTFISDGTIINSKGFDILDNGNTIEFEGKSKITLTK